MNVVGCADSINICGGKEEEGRGQLNFLITKKRGGSYVVFWRVMKFAPDNFPVLGAEGEKPKFVSTGFLLI